MDFVIGVAAAWLLDPVVIVPALVLTVACVSGVAARAFETIECRRFGRDRDRFVGTPPVTADAVAPRSSRSFAETCTARSAMG